MRRPIIKTILIAGAVAGTLDMTGALIVYAGILHRASVMIILQRITSAAVGPIAFRGGWTTAFYGLLFHYLIAFSFATAYVLLYPYFPWLKKSRVVSGLLYGVVVWVIMNRIVLPMTKIPTPPFQWMGMLIGMALLLLFIGLPIAWITAAFDKKTAAGS
jgi:hypothetical protein